MPKKYILFIFCFLFFSMGIKAQEISADSLFMLAKNAAFKEKNYSKAITLAQKAIAKNPDYLDIQIFMGRVYTWSNKTDSARNVFDAVLKKEKGNKDASLAYANLEHWNKNEIKALMLCDTALQYHPNAIDLLTLKSKVLIAVKKYKEANTVIENILDLDPKNTEARELSDRIKGNAGNDKISVNYDFTYFDKQSDHQWHLISLDYTKKTKIGPVIPRINFANKYDFNGLQFETDFYPLISNVFYGYISAGYSSNTNVFPKYRWGASLYANLPKGFQIDGGVRYLYFSDATWSYTGSIGKYYKSFLFTFKTYLTPGGSDLAQSYSASARYYHGDTSDDYLIFSAGTGVSPDANNNILLEKQYLHSVNFSAEYKQTVKKYNIISFGFSWANQEYQPGEKDNQFDFLIGYQRKLR